MKNVQIIEQPCAAHFICARDCKFWLTTAVIGPYGKFVVSTVGEWRPPPMEGVSAALLKLLGDDPSGVRQIGFERFYETMVFHAERIPKEKCGCKWFPISGRDIDGSNYLGPFSKETENEARKGHAKLVKKWATLAAKAPKKKTPTRKAKK